MEGMGLKLTPVVLRQLLSSLAYLGLWLAFLGLIVIPNTLIRGSSDHPFPPPSCPPLTHATCDITVAVKIVIKH